MNLSDWQQFFGDDDTVVVNFFDKREQAGRHFIREHAEEGVRDGALIRWRGAWYAHRQRFPEFAVRVGRQMAQRAVDRARASGIDSSEVAA